MLQLRIESTVTLCFPNKPPPKQIVRDRNKVQHSTLTIVKYFLHHFLSQQNWQEQFIPRKDKHHRSIAEASSKHRRSINKASSNDQEDF